MPGITGAALANQLPLNGCCLSTAIYSEDQQANPREVQRTSFVLSSPGHLHTMQIPLISGRFLNDDDASSERLVVAINQSTARRYWPNQNPVGAYGRVSGPRGDRFQVVGVVGDVRTTAWVVRLCQKFTY
jgi:putative ABC transport system permease protein